MLTGRGPTSSARKRELAEIRQIGIILWKMRSRTEFLQTSPIREQFAAKLITSGNSPEKQKGFKANLVNLIDKTFVIIMIILHFIA